MTWWVYRDWHGDGPGLLGSLRECFTYGPGDDRATGYLYGDGQPWPQPLAEPGPQLLAALAALTRVTFTLAAYQAYRDGTGCGWHADMPFNVQAILSLGVTRTFGIRSPGGPAQWIQLAEGDLLFMPAGFQAGHEHCVPAEDVPGERCSIVFRTPAGEDA